MTPYEVLNSTTPQVRKVIEEILRIEKANKHIQNLSSNRAAESKITEEILRVINQEIS